MAITPGSAPRNELTPGKSTPSGTASSVKSTDRRRSPKVPAATTAAISRLMAGSSQTYRVTPIATPATTTPSETPASAAM